MPRNAHHIDNDVQAIEIDSRDKKQLKHTNNVIQYKKWWEENAPEGIEYGKCWCGCGEDVSIAQSSSRKYNYIKNEPVKYINGHNAKNRIASKSTRKKLRKSKNNAFQQKLTQLIDQHKRLFQHKYPNIKYGQCACGCCNNTLLAKKTNSRWNHVKGEPVFFVNGHNSKGENNPFFQRKHTEEHKCYGSKNGMYGKKHTIEALRKISLSSSMQNNPNWKGGKSFEKYPPQWNEKLKRFIRTRDSNTCCLCGKRFVKNKNQLDVHHINYIKKDCSQQNLITLCHKCHVSTNYNREYWFCILDLYNELRFNFNGV